jgi:hypothetical protein
VDGGVLGLALERRAELEGGVVALLDLVEADAELEQVVGRLLLIELDGLARSRRLPRCARGEGTLRFSWPIASPALAATICSAR